ncbi:unnamed protein product, partial [Didymodactylos carnosus]
QEADRDTPTEERNTRYRRGRVSSPFGSERENSDNQVSARDPRRDTASRRPSKDLKCRAIALSCAAVAAMSVPVAGAASA